MEMYLDKEELAKVLKIPVTSVDYYRRGKGLPHIKIGRHNRYILAEVVAWLRKERSN